MGRPNTGTIRRWVRLPQTLWGLIEDIAKKNYRDRHHQMALIVEQWINSDSFLTSMPTEITKRKLLDGTEQIIITTSSPLQPHPKKNVGTAFYSRGKR